MAEHVILFAGPMGAGKTTAIRSLSEIDVVSTEAANNDRATNPKATTTVALDYGEITVNDTEKVRLYGVPGQRRFDFMWEILKERAKGLILLVNVDAEDPVALAAEYLAEFRGLADSAGVLIGLSHADLISHAQLTGYADAISGSHSESPIPVLTVDPRDTASMTTVLMTLVANIEMKQAMTPVEMGGRGVHS